MQENEMTYFKTFRGVCKAVCSSLNLKEVLDLIVNNTITTLNLKACAIFLLNKKKERLEISASSGLSESYHKKGPVDAEKSIIASLDGETVLVDDATSDHRIQYPKEAKREGIASILSVPIPVKGEVIGVLRIYTAVPRRFSDTELEFISGLAEMGGIAIENARMYDYLKADHETLINDVHQWFEYGRTP